MVEDEINKPFQDYLPQFNTEPDERVNYYLTGCKMVFAQEMNERPQALGEKKWSINLFLSGIRN
jgi:hypothetical protein